MELVSSWVTARLHLLSLSSHMDLTIDHLHCDLFYLTTLRASFIPPLFFPSAYHRLIHALIFPCLCIPFQQVRFSCIPQASLGSHVPAVSPLCSPFFSSHFCLATQPYWLDLSSIHERALRVELLAIPP